MQGVGVPKNDMKVVKCGAASDVTYAKVDGIEGSFVMDYSEFGDQVRWMDAVRIVPDPSHPNATDEISLRGDSGAVWMEATTGIAIALTFAGEDFVGPTAEFALAHPLGEVLTALGVDLAVDGAS
jgi:hypothetical protein